MVFALETFWPCRDGWRAARIEEEIVVTPTGHEVITRFPAEKLLVAGATYVTVNGPPFQIQVVRIEITLPLLPPSIQRLPQARVT